METDSKKHMQEQLKSDEEEIKQSYLNKFEKEKSLIEKQAKKNISEMEDQMAKHYKQQLDSATKKIEQSLTKSIGHEQKELYQKKEEAELKTEMNKITEEEKAYKKMVERNFEAQDEKFKK